MYKTKSGKEIDVHVDLTAEINKAIKELAKYKPTTPNCLYNFEVGM